MASENEHNLKYIELRLWLPGTGENQKEKALNVSLLYIDNASKFIKKALNVSLAIIEEIV